MLATERGELLEFYREISGAKGGERPAAANIRIKNAIIIRRGTPIIVLHVPEALRKMPNALSMGGPRP